MQKILALVLVIGFVSGLAVAAIPSIDIPYEDTEILSAKKLNDDFEYIEARLQQLDAKRSTLVANGKSWSLDAVFREATTATYNGAIATAPNLKGYLAAKRICELELGSGTAHMCTTAEMARSAQLGVVPPTDTFGWVAAATYGPVLSGGVEISNNDCGGFVVDDFECTGELRCVGSGFGVGSSGVPGPDYFACNTAHPILCCD